MIVEGSQTQSCKDDVIRTKSENHQCPAVDSMFALHHEIGERAGKDPKNHGCAKYKK
jgi:hypothetical protein